MDNPQSFHAEAAYQPCCAVCGSTGPFEAHHVVEKQELKRCKMPINDPRLALRLCGGIGARPNPLPGEEHSRVGTCHERQTTHARKVRVTELTDDNLACTYEFLRARAGGYIRRHYEGTDPRMDRLEEEFGGVTA